MRFLFGWPVQRLVLATIAVFAAVAGIAYATTSDTGPVFNACMLNATGTIRIVDPAAPSGSLRSKPCIAALETAISFSQRGPTGLQGPPGTNGLNGTNGAAGAKGATGPTGPAGPVGPKGTDGASGPKGDTGAAGPKGTDGTNGANGTNGAKGDTGAQGPQGIPGPSGGAGASVTTRALATGDAACPTGGVAVESSSGRVDVCNGATGAQGARGADGPAGANGSNAVSCALESRIKAALPSFQLSSDCSGPPTACDDGNSATDDAIVGGVCRYTPKPVGAPCSPPTGGQADGAGTCLPPCDDGNSATDDVIFAGVCQHPPKPVGAPCSPPLGGQADGVGHCVDPTGLPLLLQSFNLNRTVTSSMATKLQDAAATIGSALARHLGSVSCARAGTGARSIVCV